jgi:hypothetical protein
VPWIDGIIEIVKLLMYSSKSFPRDDARLLWIDLAHRLPAKVVRMLSSAALFVFFLAVFFLIENLVLMAVMMRKF